MSKRLTCCESCDFVHLDTRNKHPGQWMCVKFPRLEGTSAVAPTVWSGREPYNRCVNINLGYCPLYERRRDGQKELLTKTETEKETET